MLTRDYFDDVRGFVYIPTQAYNAYQMWRDYDSAVTERDFGYAESMGFNAVRLWLSYEYWLVRKDRFKRSFEDMLTIAAQKGIKVMPSLFESCGRQPTEENITDTNPLTATAIASPGRDIETDVSRWSEAYKFIDWFMDIYKDDKRLLAIELTNEPSPIREMQMDFARGILRYAADGRGLIPLTVGAARMEFNIPFLEHGLDILQYHENFALTEKGFEDNLLWSKTFEKLLNKPMWICEWQRLRRSGIGWDAGTTLEVEDVMPNHSSMAGIIKKHKTGNFIWSLMLKPAYLLKQRAHGTFSGIFHEDGSVYSLEDAKAASYNENFTAPENPTIPEIFRSVLRS